MTHVQYLIGKELAGTPGHYRFFYEKRPLEGDEFDSETSDVQRESLDELAEALVEDALAEGWVGERRLAMHIFVRCGGFTQCADEMGFEFLRERYVGARAYLNLSNGQKKLLYSAIDREIRKRVPLHEGPE